MRTTSEAGRSGEAVMRLARECAPSWRPLATRPSSLARCANILGSWHGHMPTDSLLLLSLTQSHPLPLPPGSVHTLAEPTYRPCCIMGLRSQIHLSSCPPVTRLKGLSTCKFPGRVLARMTTRRVPRCWGLLRCRQQQANQCMQSRHQQDRFTAAHTQGYKHLSTGTLHTGLPHVQRRSMRTASVCARNAGRRTLMTVSPHSLFECGAEAHRSNAAGRPPLRGR